jgi:hypothetical protein
MIPLSFRVLSGLPVFMQMNFMNEVLPGGAGPAGKQLP